MLRRLTIDNYGLIARAEIEFAMGATVFTGETGSGKTMVLGAIGFALGERATADVVRKGAPRAAVTLEFEASDALRRRFTDDGYALDPGENGIITREMSDAGKSSVRLNGRPTTAGYIREIAPALADMVGQHDAQRLLAPAYHVELLDRFAGDSAAAARERVRDAYARAESSREELRTLSADERRGAEQLASKQFSLDEIQRVAPLPGEDDRLSDRRRYFDNIERIALALRQAHEALANESGSASDALGNAAAALHAVAGLGGELEDLSGAAAALQSEAAEVAARVLRHLDTVDFNQSEMDAIVARLDELDRLKRKYGGSIEAVLHSAEESAIAIERFGNREAELARVRAELDRAQIDLDASAKTLSALRHSAAKKLRERIAAELADLALPAARFDTSFEPLAQSGPAGAEHVEFTFSANKGQAQRPLARVASGGELSRVLLALVAVLASTRERTALIFDEIDAGIGGATATAVGIRLGHLAAASQVACVTHLAQIASWADRHYVLEKAERNGATIIEVQSIESTDERIREIARMLSGESHVTAVAHARTLLDRTQERRTAL
ncbi:MAG: DNA repair protein RecN [Candidatus Eremiobacteraeota bacterium]|nr:DNA repair protein RecN [Candidatus Eremiobacteraeota bacterium]